MSDLRARLQNALGDAYRVENELGGGGMSRVFLAQERELGRQVVVKVLPPEMAAGVNAERFRREIQLAASLQHPHIVPLLAAGHADDLVYYAMPLIEGDAGAPANTVPRIASLREYLFPGLGLPRLLPGRGVDHLELHPLVRHGEVQL